MMQNRALSFELCHRRETNGLPVQRPCLSTSQLMVRVKFSQSSHIASDICVKRPRYWEIVEQSKWGKSKVKKFKLLGVWSWVWSHMCDVISANAEVRWRAASSLALVGAWSHLHCDLSCVDQINGDQIDATFYTSLYAMQDSWIDHS